MARKGKTLSQRNTKSTPGNSRKKAKSQPDRKKQKSLLAGRPRIDYVDPPTVRRGMVITISGDNFSPVRLSNAVDVDGTPMPVLAASARELRVLVTEDVDSGTVKVKVGGYSATAPHPITIEGYPGDGEDGPPVFTLGDGQGGAGDVNPIGTIRVLVVICQSTDVRPLDLVAVRDALNVRWTNVQSYYDQASFGRTDLRFDIAAAAANLNGVFTDFVNVNPPVQNIIPAQLSRIAAISAQSAVNQGFDINAYQMLCSVVFTNGAFIRAWGGSDTQSFFYDDGLPSTNPNHIHISIALTARINLLWINETADWGRFAHEFGHNLVSAPTSSGVGTTTLGEDVYGSDLVDPLAANAQNFEMMGNHDSHPIFTGYHLEKLGYYAPANIKRLTWNGIPHSEEIDLIAHGLSEDTVANRFHLLKITISSGLSYFVEVRQRPGTTTQIFDSQIPIGAAPNQGGVIVTRAISDVLHNNQQTRFITLMHATRVQITGDTIDDPARNIRISVVDDNVQSRPQVCRVRVEWARAPVGDPSGKFDLSIEPWDTGANSPDIWVDRDPFGTFDNPSDSAGRPTGNGDRPWLVHLNRFYTRVHVSGILGASNVKVTYYASFPPNVGDNGNWSPIGVQTIASIPPSGFVDVFQNWVPIANQHTCLKAFISSQNGEISPGNNSAQENIASFQAAGASPVEPIFIRTAIRNPLDDRAAVHVALRGVPRGWAAQIPHAWVWLNGREEKLIDVLVWPVVDVNEYRFGSSEGKLPGMAPIQLVGYVERDYQEITQSTGTVAGSRFFNIGAVFYPVDVRRKATIDIKGLDPGDKVVFVNGYVAPPHRDQRVLLDVTLPDGKTHNTLETKTGASGGFNAPVGLLDRAGNLQPGTYRIQASIFSADDLEDATSGVALLNR